MQNTAAGIGVTPDRRAVYAAIPRLGAVAVADVNTNSVTSLIPVTAGPGALAIVPDEDAVLVPYTVDAVDDAATATTTGGTPIASVLANDRFGGMQADLAHLTLTQLSSSSEGVAVDPATGAVHVAAGTAVGIHTLVYRICEIAAPSNCDDATVTVTIRTPSVVDAVNDSATTLPGRRALVSVLANDTIDGAPAAGRVTLSTVSSTSATIQLDVSTGAVYVWVGTVPGPHTLTVPHLRHHEPAGLRHGRRGDHREPLPDRCRERCGGGAAVGRDRARQRARQRQIQRRGGHARQGPPVAGRVLPRRHLAQRRQRRRDRGRGNAGWDLHAPVPHLRDRDARRTATRRPSR